MMQAGRTSMAGAVADRRWSALAVAVLLLGLLLVTAAGCSGSGGDETGATTTSAAGDTAGSGETTGGADVAPGSDIATGTQTYTVGGKTPDEYKAEIPQLQEQLKNTPDDLTVLQSLAVAQYQTGDYGEAAKTYEKMLAVEDDPMTRNNYANVLRDAKLTDEAKAQYQQAIAADPALTVAYINLSSVLLSEDKVDDGLAILDKGIANTTGEEKKRLQGIKDAMLAGQTTTTAAQ